MENLTQIKWLTYSVMHPSGFEDMRWKKAGSLKISSCLILLFFIAEITENRFFGMQFFINDERNFNIITYFIKSIILFFIWTLGNWSVSIFLDGKGIFKNIFIYSSYALFPYISQIFINIFLSHILVRDEYVFMQIVEFIGTLWTLFLLFSAVKSVHQYTVKRTFLAVFLTIIAMFSIIVILIIFILLLRQVFMFFSTIYMEIFYRVKML
ncbi:MAG: YIP1 family protein [Ruminococcus sp.]|nr:YIP1 family protein [Ruminococcus sp.]